jgi:hypothetical protein
MGIDQAGHQDIAIAVDPALSLDTFNHLFAFTHRNNSFPVTATAPCVIISRSGFIVKIVAFSKIITQYPFV